MSSKPTVPKGGPGTSTSGAPAGVSEGAAKKLAAADGDAPLSPTTATLPTYRSTPRPGSGSSFWSTLLTLYLCALVLIEVAAVVRIFLGSPLHEACPLYAQAKRSASFVSLAQTFLAVLAAVRLNTLYNDESVDGWRACSWVHVLEAV